MATETITPESEKPPAPPPETTESAIKEVPPSIKDGFLSVLGGKLEPIKKPNAKPEEKGAESPKDDIPPAKDKAEPDKIEQPPKPQRAQKRRDRATEPDTAEIAARAAAAATAEVMARHQPAPEKKEAPKPLAEQIPSQYKKKLEVFQEMAAAAPDRYGSLVTDFVSAINHLEAYKATWEKDNPGSKFDSDDPAHNEFFECNELDYDEDDYHDARTAIRIKPLEEKAKKADALEKQIKEIQATEEARKLEPAIASIKMDAAKQVIADIDPDLFKVIDDNNAFKERAEADPITADISISAANHASELVGEAVRIIDGQGKINIDWNAPVAQAFIQTKNEIEADIKALPLDDQYDDQGRRFATWTEYDAILRHRPEAAGKYWFLNKEMLVLSIPKKIANRARNLIKQESERFDAIAKARGFKSDTAPDKTPKAATAKLTEQPKVPAVQPAASPAAAGGKTAIDPTAKPQTEGAHGWQEKFLGRLTGRIS